MSITSTDIVNMALGKLGAKQIATGYTLDTDTTPDGLQAKLHYAQTRDSLLRSYEWRFASGRAILQMDSVVPAFEYSNQFLLPQDYLRMKSVYSCGSAADSTMTYSDSIPPERWTIEGNKLLINETDVSILYVKQITDTTKFDSLFVEVLILQLALKLLHPLAGTDATQLKQGLLQELDSAVRRARTVSSADVRKFGSSDFNVARYGSGITY